MAMVVYHRCTKCHQYKQTSTQSGAPHPLMCYKCSSELKSNKREEYLEALDGLTIEQRIRNIEELLYDQVNQDVPKLLY